jgi:hypothetical protein
VSTHCPRAGESYFPLRQTESNGNEVAAASRVKVAPLPGRALVFDHGLMHGGAFLRKGAKHLIRTDVVYACPPGTVPPAWATAKIRYMT